MAAAAQRWSLTSPVLGGRTVTADGFEEITFGHLGLAHDRPDIRRTTVGTYQLLPVAAGAVLDGCAALVGAVALDGGGLIVVGTDEVPEEAVAVLVLSPLIQFRLPFVPWALLHGLTTPSADPLAPAVRTPDAPEVVAEDQTRPSRETATGTRPSAGRPQRERRMPSWRSPKPMERRRRSSAPERAMA